MVRNEWRSTASWFRPPRLPARQESVLRRVSPRSPCALSQRSLRLKLSRGVRLGRKNRKQFEGVLAALAIEFLKDLLLFRDIPMSLATDITPNGSGYAELARRPLEAEQCALVVIDIQEKLLPPIFQKEQLLRNTKLLIRAAGVLKLP